MQQRLIFNLPLDSVFEMIHQTLDTEGKVSISNKAARLISGKLNTSAETIKIDIQLISKNNKGMLIFNTDIDDGLKFYNLLEKTIRTHEKQIEESETINEKDLADITELVECPYCAEKIQPKAVKCRYCAEFIQKKELINYSSKPQKTNSINHQINLTNSNRKKNSQKKNNSKKRKTPYSTIIGGIIIFVITIWFKHSANETSDFTSEFAEDDYNEYTDYNSRSNSTEDENQNELSRNDYKMGTDGRVYETKACDLCEGTGIEKSRSSYSKEYGRICPVCDGRGVKSY